MREHIVICVLSTFTFSGSSEPDGQKTLEAGSYEYKPKNPLVSAGLQAESLVVKGQQTNEAPVSCLIQLADWNTPGNPVTRVVYLCTKEAQQDVQFFDEATGELHNMSPERHFMDMVRANCSDQMKGREDAEFFIRVDFDGKYPARSLGDLVRALGPGALVDIDTTGGFRDAIFLLTNAVHVIKMESRIARNEGSGWSLGTVLYSRKTASGGRIIEQKDTFDLIDLVNAVDAFTRYGKAEQLAKYFSDPRASMAVRNLCENMQRFSDDLALCRTGDIINTVRNINDCLVAVLREREKSEERYVKYMLASRCIDLLENGLGIGEVRALISEAIEAEEGEWREIEQREWFQLVNLPKPEKLRKKLEEREAEYSTWRGEVLFQALVPSIQGGFIDSNRGSDQVIDIIRWCLDRQMIVQALALFRERLPRVLLDRGYIQIGSDGNPAKTSLADRVASLVIVKGWSYKNEMMERFESHLKETGSSIGREDKCLLLCCKPAVFVDKEKLRVTESGARFLPAILVWHRYVLRVRNEIMHADLGDNASSGVAIEATERFFGEDLFGFQGAESAASIAQDLKRALSEFENPRSLDDLLGSARLSGKCKYKWLFNELDRFLSDKTAGGQAGDAGQAAESAKNSSVVVQQGLPKWMLEMRESVDRAAADNPGRLLTWEMVFPDEGDIPSSIRDKHPNSVIGDFCRLSDRYEAMLTLVVDTEAQPAKSTLRKTDMKARDHLIEMVSRSGTGVVTAEDIAQDSHFQRDPASVIKSMASLFKPQLRKGTSYIKVLPDNG